MKSTIMKEAHKSTKATIIQFGGNYKATFAIALSQIYACIKKEKKEYNAKYFLQEKIAEKIAKTYTYRVLQNIQFTKETENQTKLGIIEMTYAEYKRNFSSCKTVDGSYDKKAKTIKVYTFSAKSNVKAYGINSLCPICGTYCCGSC